MIFTAAIYVCLIGEPHTYQNCEVVEGKVKFETEQQCMSVVVNKVNSLYENTPIMERYEIIDLKCHQFGSKKESL
jgi:hypothetical protein